MELLHGGFGCGWGAGCEKNKALALPGLETTQQGIFQSLFGMGTGLGALFGGMLAQQVGLPGMFFWGGFIIAANSFAAMLLRALLLHRQGVGAMGEAGTHRA